MATTSHRYFHLNPLSLATSRLEEAEYYFLAGNLNEALAAAQQAWREHPREADVFRVLAYIHMARGEYPPAAQAAYQAVKLDADNPASYASLGQVYVTFNMLPLALETLDVALKRYPDDPSLLVLHADVLFRRGRQNEAVPLATRALEHNPHDGYAKALLGTYRLRRREYAAASMLLADAVAAYPQRWDYLRDYGIALLHAGDHHTAREILTRAFRLNPAEPTIGQHLFLALRLTGGGSPAYWRMARTFYRRSTLGVLLLILAAGSILAGVIWGVVLAYTWREQYGDAAYAGMLFLGGLAIIILVQAGVFLHSRKGNRFDAYLRRSIGAE